MIDLGIVCWEQCQLTENLVVESSYDTGTISGILGMDYFKYQFAKNWNEDGKPIITANEQALIVSILSAGTFFGALGASFLADLMGRRWGIIISCIVFCVGVVLQVAAVEQNIFIAGRAIAGFGVGLVSAIGMYIQISLTHKYNY
jgi:SP family sugar:H+ symporter-like MFS transporter